MSTAHSLPKRSSILKVMDNCSPWFNGAGAKVDAIGNLEMNVILDPSNNTLAPAFTLNGTIEIAGKAMISGTILTGNLSYIDGKFDLAKSEIGNFDVSILNNLLQLFFSSGLVPAINVFLKQGLPLPTVQGELQEC